MSINQSDLNLDNVLLPGTRRSVCASIAQPMHGASHHQKRSSSASPPAPKRRAPEPRPVAPCHRGITSVHPHSGPLSRAVAYKRAAPCVSLPSLAHSCQERLFESWRDVGTWDALCAVLQEDAPRWALMVSSLEHPRLMNTGMLLYALFRSIAFSPHARRDTIFLVAEVIITYSMCGADFFDDFNMRTIESRVASGVMTVPEQASALMFAITRAIGKGHWFRVAESMRIEWLNDIDWR